MDTDRTLSTPGRRAGSFSAHRLLLVASPDLAALGRAVTLGEGGDAASAGSPGLGSREDADDARTVGRAGHVEGALALADGELSRRHAVLEAEPSTHTYWIRDLDSRNGTFVNGLRVERAGLVDQDVIRCGASLFVYERVELEADAPIVAASQAPLFGRSLAMARVRGEVARVAARDMPVLVLGESGAGKELVARALHEESGRRGAQVSINCGALPADLVESELFGHVAGAFTGANKAKDGLFVAAEGGTLFLDEIGEMPAAVQPKLLRALATGAIRPVGATGERRVDVRVVAATNRDLRAEVEAARFRGDLYARLAGWVVELPPLRRRRQDVLELAARFLERVGAPTAMEPDAAEALLLHRWPFNVRELEQACAAIAVRAADRERVLLEHLGRAIAAPLATRRPEGPTPAAPLALSVRPDETPTAEELKRVLAHHGGNIARVAEYFGRDRRQVYRWLDRYGMR